MRTQSDVETVKKRGKDPPTPKKKKRKCEAKCVCGARLTDASVVMCRRSGVGALLTKRWAEAGVCTCMRTHVQYVCLPSWWR